MFDYQIVTNLKMPFLGLLTHPLTLFLHPEVHAPVGERHAKGDAHHHRETLLQRGEGDGDQQSRQQH